MFRGSNGTGLALREGGLERRTMARQYLCSEETDHIFHYWTVSGLRIRFLRGRKTPPSPWTACLSRRSVIPISREISGVCSGGSPAARPCRPAGSLAL